MQPETNSPQSQTKVVDPDRWKPGTYAAKCIDWNVSESKSGAPAVELLFQYMQPGDQPGTTEQRQLIYYGSFAGGAKEFTLKALRVTGLRRPISEMVTGRVGGAIDPQDVDIVVEHRVYNGVRRAGISWVNARGGRGLEARLDPGKAKMLFAGLDNEFMAELASAGIKPMVGSATGANLTPAQMAAEQGTLDNSDIPF